MSGISKTLFSQTRKFCPLYEYDNNITAGKDVPSNELCIIPLYGSTGPIGKVATPSYNEPLVLVARVGSIGTVQYVDGFCGVSDNTLIIRGKEHSRYIYHFLKTFNFSKITSGTTQPLITASSLKTILIPSFSSSEQSAITALLDCLDNMIVVETYILYKLKKQKQHLLQQMFI